MHGEISAGKFHLSKVCHMLTVRHVHLRYETDSQDPLMEMIEAHQWTIAESGLRKKPAFSHPEVMCNNHVH